MVKILGVDFSGARDDRKTWVAEGQLDDDRLNLESCRSVQRPDLAVILANLDGPAVVAMDFPFSVPAEFAKCWKQEIPANGGTAPVFETMPHLWATAANTEWKTFEEIVLNFGKRGTNPGEWKWPVRECDGDIHEAQSPLKPKGNPTMLPMTFRGMQLLHRLWQCPTVNHVCVPPLSFPCRDCYTTLLEVMPGAVLSRLGIRHQKYKGSSKAADRKREKDQRRKILSQLKEARMTTPFEVVLLESVSNSCLENREGDALDAVVAAVTAAMWHIDPQQFRRPEDIDGVDWETVMLEDWLYAPKEVKQKK